MTRLLLVLAFALLVGCDAAPTTVPVVLGGCPGVDYPAWQTSEYVLPYPVGETYLVLQGNCGGFSHTYSSAIAFAYDFPMPIGEVVTATRAGTVAFVEEQYQDGDFVRGHENGVGVDHGDGTWAFYIHFTQNGALVDPGDTVAPGDTLGLSGNTGFSTEPHLHFDVRGDCPEFCESIPVTFRNAGDNPRGLLPGRFYSAR